MFMMLPSSRPAPTLAGRRDGGSRDDLAAGMWRSAERLHPLLDVGQVGGVPGDPGEQFARPRGAACPVVQVSQRIGAAEMMPHRTFGRLPVLLQQTNGAGEITLVSLRSSDNDATFNDEFGARRCLTQLGPKRVDIGPVAEGSMGIGEDWMLLG